MGFVAVNGSAADLAQTFAGLWSDYEIVASESGFSVIDAVFAWKAEHEEFVSAADWTPENPGKQVYLISTSGQWAVIWDSTYVLPTDEKEILELSRLFDIAIAVIVESASGTGFLRCYEGGSLQRSIDYYDGEFTASGEPLTAEAGIVDNVFYMDEAEQLCEALGIELLTESSPVEGLTALAVVDHTDYSDEMPDSPSPVSSATNRPQKAWWKFW